MKTNQSTRLLDGKNREYNVVLALGGRGLGEGELNEKFPKNTPSSVLWTPSPSRGEGHSGFTLIELLVVVLIIGILAGVALPQYNKAVIKARASEINSFVSSVEKSMGMYLLENGGYPSSTITDPWNALTIGYSNYCTIDTSNDSKCNGKNFTAYLDIALNNINMSLSLEGNSIDVHYMDNGQAEKRCTLVGDALKAKYFCEALVAIDPSWKFYLGSADW